MQCHPKRKGGWRGEGSSGLTNCLMEVDGTNEEEEEVFKFYWFLSLPELEPARDRPVLVYVAASRTEN